MHWELEIRYFYARWVVGISSRYNKTTPVSATEVYYQYGMKRIHVKDFCYETSCKFVK